ncbi:MAG: hypothetical protein ACLS3T_04385 [Anaerobutyricum sp.]
MKKVELETKKVAELKQMSRERGLKLESKGHKFTKSELIERLLQSDDEQNDINKKIEEAADDEEAWDEPVLKHEVKEEPVKEQKKEETNETVFIRFAETIEQIETKYGKRKKQEIYDNELEVGCFVAFIHYVEAADGNIYKKLRTAKVVGINRKKELVRVSTLLGTELELGFEQLLYIRGKGRECSYPWDIKKFLVKHRTEKGKYLINERFNSIN